MSTLIALLRGINLGPSRRLAMADLRELLTEAGFEDVRTLLQSGNVVLSTSKKPQPAATAIEEAIEARTEMEVDVIARTAAELEKIVAADPFADVRDDGARQFVTFLSAKPNAAARKLLDDDFAPDRLVIAGREIYTWCPDGMRDSRLMKLLSGRKIAPIATVRNWNTVTKLAEMAR